MSIIVFDTFGFYCSNKYWIDFSISASLVEDFYFILTHSNTHFTLIKTKVCINNILIKSDNVISFLCYKLNGTYYYIISVKKYTYINNMYVYEFLTKINLIDHKSILIYTTPHLYFMRTVSNILMDDTDDKRNPFISNKKDNLEFSHDLRNNILKCSVKNCITNTYHREYTRTDNEINDTLWKNSEMLKYVLDYFLQPKKKY